MSSLWLILFYYSLNNLHTLVFILLQVSWVYSVCVEKPYSISNHYCAVNLIHFHYGYLVIYQLRECCSQAETLNSMSVILLWIGSSLFSWILFCEILLFWSLQNLWLSVSSGNSLGHRVFTFPCCGTRIFLGSNLGILMDPFVLCLVEMTSSKFNVQHIENYHNFPHFQIVYCCFVLVWLFYV